MAFLGDLIVKMGADVKPLTSGLSKAKKEVTGFGASLTSLMSPATAVFSAAAVGAASAAGAIYVVTGRIAELASIADKATQTGLSGAFLQRLGYAADQSGVSVDTLTAAIGKLTVNIGKGDGKVFSGLGVSLNELQSLDPEGQFRRIAGAISNLPTAAERASAAVKVFGKSGIEMTGLFAGGMTDLNALLADAAKLGIGVSDESLAKAAAADDAIQRMKASFGALIDQVAIGLAPTFQGIATSIADMISPTTILFDKFNNMGEKTKFISDLFRTGMTLAIETISAKWSEMLTDLASKTVKTFSRLSAGLSSGTLSGTMKGITSVTGGGNRKGLHNAQRDFDSVVGRLTNTPGSSPAAGIVSSPVKAPIDGKGISDAFGNLFGAMSPITSQIGTAIDQAITGAKIKGGGMLATAGSLFDGVGSKQSTSNTAGAAQKGSQEALKIAMKGARGSFEQKTIKLQEKANELMQKQLIAMKDKAQQLVAEF